MAEESDTEACRDQDEAALLLHFNLISTGS